MVSRDYGFLISELEKRLDKIEKQISEEKDIKGKDWLTKQQVLSILRISPRTLQTLRDNGILPYSQLGGKFYYKATDIENLLSQNYCK